VDRPYLRVEDSGAVHTLELEVTTLGRGPGVHVVLEDPTVSRLHAEIVIRGPHVYVSDLGLSTNGTRVNGRPIGRRILNDGDVISLGMARLRAGGLASASLEADTVELRRVVAPELTRRELEVLTCLCRPALKQHLLRLYAKFSIPEGVNRRARLANEVVRAGVVRPLPGVPDLERAASDVEPPPPHRSPAAQRQRSAPPAALPGSMASGSRSG
jgi:hypothetical protein